MKCKVEQADTIMIRFCNTTGCGLMLIVLALAACGSAPDGTGAAAEAADLLIVNGRVFAADAAGTTAEAVAVRGNTILRVGSTAEVSALRGARTRVIDAHGGSVIPGLTDTHVHFISGAFSLEQLDLGGLNTLAEVQAAIRKFAAANPGAGCKAAVGCTRHSQGHRPRARSSMQSCPTGLW